MVMLTADATPLCWQEQVWENAQGQAGSVMHAPRPEAGQGLNAAQTNWQAVKDATSAAGASMQAYALLAKMLWH